MIKTNISREYPTHISKCAFSNSLLYIADYTKQTASVRGVEVNVLPPTDIDFFTLTNASLNIAYIVFDNNSFTYPNGDPRSQCECVVFPQDGNYNSWIFFAELKYSNMDANNNNNLLKAIKQLYKTRTYYFQKRIFSKSNTCYLLASLPMQAEPFAQSVISPNDMQRLKMKHNVILRLQNHVEIQNNVIINV